jgi:hypothetical protein
MRRAEGIARGDSGRPGSIRRAEISNANDQTPNSESGLDEAP